METEKETGATETQPADKNSNMRFYLLCLCSFVFTIYLIVDQYMTNHH